MAATCAITSMAISAVFTKENAIPLQTKYQNLPVLKSVNPQEFAMELLTPKQYKCFNHLIKKESMWNDSKNKVSSAKGVGQLLDSSYKNLGMRYPESKVSQTVAALAYIGRKYGSGGPCAAWAAWQKNKMLTGTGWY
jgi:hypothetical protein